MEALTRRAVLAIGAVGGTALAASTAGAASFGNPDQPAEGAINANAAGLSDPGPKNPVINDQFPSFQNPPATDVGDMQLFWGSFNNAAKRIQNGGWARQVTKSDFAISDAVSGVNMRLGPGGIREMHWHRAAEWAIMTNGRCRITVLDTEGRAYVQDVEAGDLWYFPAGYPHSLQGLGPDGCEFVIVFDEGDQSEYGTLLLTDWLAHTSPELLAKNFGVEQDVFRKYSTAEPLDFSGQGAWTSLQGSGSRCRCRTSPSPLHLQARGLQTAEGKRRWRHSPCRQQRLYRVQNHRRRHRNNQARRGARNALAPQRGRMAILDQG